MQMFQKSNGLPERITFDNQGLTVLYKGNKKKFWIPLLPSDHINVSGATLTEEECKLPSFHCPSKGRLCVLSCEQYPELLGSISLKLMVEAQCGQVLGLPSQVLNKQLHPIPAI
ncbi:Hypothetical predicted protein [Podarcis lilfordi]|uniref:Uncharacterized protein n=1 Tax=Podarcis lilfordi TaxID=74358 RepID=A0AA35KFA4_9SAUR|nr:Hypothetical predicted protein [Podarcis lilfordi]